MNIVVSNYDSARLKAAQQISDLVAITAGPYGGNVDFHGDSNPKMYRDGFKVLQNFGPPDDLSLGVKIRMEEAAKRTVERAGDGTTTTTLLLRWIYEYASTWAYMQKVLDGDKTSDEYKSVLEALGLNAAKPQPVSRRDIANGIRHAMSHCLREVQRLAEKIDITTPKGKKLLRMVATLAGGNNEKVGEVVSSVISEIGADGYMMTEWDSKATDISSELRPGYRMPYGVIDNSMLPARRSSITIPSPYVAVVRDLINNVDNLRPVIAGWKSFCEANDTVYPLLLLTVGIDSDAVSTILHRTFDRNSQQYSKPLWQELPGNRLPWFCVKVAGMEDIWEDIEAITGAKSFNSRAGRGVKYFKPDSGIVMESVVLSRQDCVLAINATDLAQSGLIDRLKSMKESATEDQLAAIETRIARLEGRVGVIRIPVHSQANRAWSNEVLEDAYRASTTAITDGIVPGGGKMLALLAHDLEELNATFSAGGQSPSFCAGIHAVAEAFLNIPRTLLANGGVPMSVIESVVEYMQASDKWATLKMDDAALTTLHSANKDIVFDDGRKSGVIDSAAAIIAAIQSAANEAADWVETPAGVVPGSYRQ